MAYRTANGTITANAVIYADDTTLPTIKQDALLRDAERLVRRLAPPPTEPPSADYVQAASDSELRIFEWLVNWRPHLSSESVLDSSVNYAENPKVLEIVSDIMGDYYAPGASLVNTAYFETMPR